jgi:biotin synthase
MTRKKISGKLITNLYEKPFSTLLLKAQNAHRKHFKDNEMELCALLSIKSGSCPEDCAYCAQSAHHHANIENKPSLTVEEIIEQAQMAKAIGATRFCMGAAWHHPPAKDFPKLFKIIKAVKKLGLETCMTLGQLKEQEAKQLRTAGLDFYNHNLNTSANYYQKIVTTHSHKERLKTLHHIQQAEINSCCGIIIGMGETQQDRIEMLLELANLETPPHSIPINRLIPMKGTPLANVQPINNFEFIRIIAMARILFPTSVIRLAAGRDTMSDETQALCFIAGANSIFFGDKLLTTTNPKPKHDLNLLKKLGIKPKQPNVN